MKKGRHVQQKASRRKNAIKRTIIIEDSGDEDGFGSESFSQAHKWLTEDGGVLSSSDDSSLAVDDEGPSCVTNFTQYRALEELSVRKALFYDAYF